jgi:hypothetical protein
VCILSFQVEITQTEIEIGTENVGERHVIIVETIGIVEISEIAGILEITEIVRGTAGIPKTVETILIPGCLGIRGMQGRVGNQRGIKSERKLWNVAVNVSVNANARRT